MPNEGRFNSQRANERGEHREREESTFARKGKGIARGPDNELGAGLTSELGKRRPPTSQSWR